MLEARLTQYAHAEQKTMSTAALAQLLSVTLYYRRFFPYYAFCMVAGVDDDGKGAVYGYDAVGSFKRDNYGCMGSGQNFIWPMLDNLVSDCIAVLAHTISDRTNGRAGWCCRSDTRIGWMRTSRSQWKRR